MCMARSSIQCPIYSKVIIIFPVIQLGLPSNSLHAYNVGELTYYTTYNIHTLLDSPFFHMYVMRKPNKHILMLSYKKTTSRYMFPGLRLVFFHVIDPLSL